MVMSACAPASDGPLVGPRVEAGVVEVCIPAGAGEKVFFGEVLTNTGQEPVSISSITGVHENVIAVEYLVDTKGPELGQILGAGGVPPKDPMGGEDEVLGRATPAEQTRIPADSAATVYVLITPDPEADQGAVDEVTITYESGGTDYREDILVSHSVISGANC